MTAYSLTCTDNRISPAPLFSDNFVTDFVAFVDRSAKTAETYLGNLRQFICWLRYSEIRNPQRADVLAYRDWLSTPHKAIALDPAAPKGWSFRRNKAGKFITVTAKPATICLYLRSVCQLFKWLASNGLYPNIAENIHAPKISHNVHKKDALRPAEVVEIEHSINDNAEARIAEAAQAVKDTEGRIQRATEQGARLYAMYTLAVTLGLRTIELHRANVADFETKGGRSWLWVWGKGHTEPDQKKAVPQAVADAINEYLALRSDSPAPDAPLFAATGNRNQGGRIQVKTIGKMLKGAMVDAGFNSARLTAHSLRHTCGTATMAMTGDIYETQHYLRHVNPATTEIYIHSNRSEKEQTTASNLWKYYHSEVND